MLRSRRTRDFDFPILQVPRDWATVELRALRERFFLQTWHAHGAARGPGLRRLVSLAFAREAKLRRGPCYPSAPSRNNALEAHARTRLRDHAVTEILMAQRFGIHGLGVGKSHSGIHTLLDKYVVTCCCASW